MPVLEIVKSLAKLVLSREYKRPVIRNWLIDWLASEHDELRVLCHSFDRNVFSAVRVGLERDAVRSCLRGRPLDFDRSLVDDYDRVPACRDRVSIRLVGCLEVEIDEVCRCSRHYWTSDTEDVTRNDLRFHSCSIVIDGDCVRRELLVLRFAELVLGLKIYPELEAERVFFETSRHLCMDNPLASRHPLDVTRAYNASIALEILMMHLTR